MGNSRMSYAGATSVTMKNRVNPTGKVGSSAKAPLQGVKPVKGMSPDATPKNMSYSGAGKITPKGYPRSTFKGSATANKPINYGTGKIKMGSR